MYVCMSDLILGYWSLIVIVCWWREQGVGLGVNGFTMFDEWTCSVLSDVNNLPFLC